MQQTLWIEILKEVPSIVTAVTTVIGVIIAARGLHKWRQETIGKRRTELAENVLADFYEARDIIQTARSPLSKESEGESRKRADWETKEDSRTLDAYFAVFERLHSKQEFFAKLTARRYRFQAHFGRQASKPYEDLLAAYDEVIVAVELLIKGHQKDHLPSSDDKARQDKIWWSFDRDDIKTRVDAAVNEIERICRPIIRETQ